jgi:hypothetical protein
MNVETLAGYSAAIFGACDLYREQNLKEEPQLVGLVRDGMVGAEGIEPSTSPV